MNLGIDDEILWGLTRSSRLWLASCAEHSCMFLFPAPFIHNRREPRFTEPLPGKVVLLQPQRCCHGKILPVRKCKLR